MIKILYTDVETTGKKHWKHSVHQIGIVIEIDGVMADAYEFDCAPYLMSEVDPVALKIGNTTLEQLRAKPHASVVMHKLRGMLARFADITNPHDKYYICGFNTQLFDIPFLQAFWKQNEDVTFDDWFWRGSFDVMTLASYALRYEREQIPSFTLQNVAKHLNINVDTSQLHSALYDALLARDVYKKLISDGRITP